MSTAIAVGHTNSPYVSVYPWSGSGFGTKFSNPATLPTANANGVTFTTSRLSSSTGLAFSFLLLGVG